jgi:hypothetical protein
MSLEIGTLVIPLLAGMDIDQQYSALGSETILRAVSGRGIKQMTYNRMRVTTGGSGWMPAGLEALDFTAQHVIKCVVPRGLTAVFATRQATLPAARRSDGDYTPFGTALLAAGRAVNTPVSMAGNVATCTAVSGAVSYHVSYYPAPTVWIMRPETSGSLADASYRWDIVAEEV